MRIFTQFIILAFSVVAHAGTVTFTDVKNASNYVQGMTPADVPIVYGAVAGPTCPSNSGPNDFCDNCNGNYACSQKRIHANLKLRLEFTVTGLGYIVLGMMDRGTYTQLPTSVYTRSSSELVRHGDTGYVEIKWGTICSLYNAGDQNCEMVSLLNNLFVAVTPDDIVTADEASLINVRLFAPASNMKSEISDITCGHGKSGICSFKVLPNNGMGYVSVTEMSGSYPTIDMVPFKALRLYYETTPGADILNIDYSFPYFDIPLEQDGQLTSGILKGLVNGQFYGFKSAMVDEAGNVSMMLSNQQITNECRTGTTLDARSDLKCPYIVAPRSWDEY